MTAATPLNAVPESSVPPPEVERSVRFRVLGDGEGAALAQANGVSASALADIEARIYEKMFRRSMLSGASLPPFAPYDAFLLGARWAALMAAENPVGAPGVLAVAERACEGYGVQLPELDRSWTREQAFDAVEGAICEYTQRHLPSELHVKPLPIELPQLPEATPAGALAPSQPVLPVSVVHDLVRKAVEWDRPSAHAAGYQSAAAHARQAIEACRAIGDVFAQAGFSDSDLVLPILRELLAGRPAATFPYPDTGVWRYGVTAEKCPRGFVESSDFACDVRLYLIGDFADDEQRMRYGKDVARRLNATALPHTGMEPAQEG